jgi:hypothetical protein
MAARTGKGYEKHGKQVPRQGNRYRVKVEGRYVSFDDEKAAGLFVQERAAERLMNAIGVKRSLKGTQRLAREAFTDNVDSPTVVEYARELIDDKGLRPNTRRAYETALRWMLADEIASIPVGEVKPADVRRFYNRVDRNWENVKHVLSKVFNQAIREGMVTVSPLRQAGIKAPKKNGKVTWGDPRILTADEVERL